jgi:DNA mismatch repair protein PMS2
LQEEQHDRCLSISGAPNKYSEVEHLNTFTDNPLPNAHDSDNDAAVYSTSVQYPIVQFAVADVRRRRKKGFMTSHANKANFLEKATG